MANTPEQFQQILVSQTQINQATPTWSIEAQRDYYRFKLDLLTAAETGDDLEERVSQNEQDIVSLGDRAWSETEPEQFDDATSYTEGDYVIYQNAWYKARRSTGPSEFIVDDWRKVGAKIAAESNPTTIIYASDVNQFESYDDDFVYLKNGDQILIENALDIGNRVFNIPDGAAISISGVNPLISKIETTSSGALFSGDQVDILIEKIGLTIQNGKCFDFTNTAGFSFVFVQQCIIADAQTIGDISDLNLFTMEFSIVTNLSSGGLTVSGNNTGRVFIEQCPVESFAGTFVDLTASTLRTFKLSNCDFRTQAGNVIVNTTANSGDIASGGIGEVIDNRDFDDFGVYNGIASQDLLWEFRGNSGVISTYNLGFNSFNNNVVSTISPLTPTPIEGVATLFSESARFEKQDDNGLKALNRDPIVGQCQASLTVSKSGGAAFYDFQFYLDEGGGFNPIGNQATIEVKNTAVTFSFFAPTQIKEGFKWQIYVTGTETILVKDLSFQVG